MGGIEFGIIVLIIGMTCLLFNKFVAQWHIEFQNRFFGYDFGDRERRISRFFFILGGIVSSLIGALILLHNLSVF